MKKLAVATLFISIALNSFAQKSDASLKSLIKADQSFSAKAQKDNLKSAYLAYTADDGIVFRPNIINTIKYYNTLPNEKLVKWNPDFARLSRSRNWGITAGNFEGVNDSKYYGRYISVWREDDDEKWKLIINIQTETARPVKGKVLKNNFIEPKDTYRPKFASQKDLKAGADIIFSTEKILNTILKTHGPLGFSGFLSESASLVFPGTEFIEGKKDILAFNNRMMDKINLKTIQVDKALGGDYAYSYGLATIDYKNDFKESFNYLFVWERQADGDWNIINQLYTLADR